MPAADYQFSSGLSGLDRLLQGIKPGDNVVLKVGSVADYLHRAGEVRSIMLIGPGRWGTSSPSLGVPVSFSEIKNTRILVEIAAMHEGLIPDISLGTHFFNDLVEMDMLYLAVFPDRQNNLFNEKLLLSLPNQLIQLLPEEASWEQYLHVTGSKENISGKKLYPYADPAKQKATGWLD